ncbi:MAG: hypothetical protein R3D80_17070 [Paracoccaceae bacterium]
MAFESCSSERPFSGKAPVCQGSLKAGTSPGAVVGVGVVGASVAVSPPSAVSTGSSVGCSTGVGVGEVGAVAIAAGVR